MGVKQLWGILEPAKEVVELDSLSGKVVAVDLGFWVVQMQMAVGGHHPSTAKLYLRNLFFRISALLQRNVTVIAVSDGDPPALKAKTMRDRQDGGGHRQWWAKKNKKPAAQPSDPVPVPKRSRFRAMLRECCRMVSLMGVEVVEANGEAEAFCSFLNHTGVVDGVITDDSDAFLYGATVVYRHFNLESKVPTIERYAAKRILDNLSLDRHDMIALGLLLGCDYSESLCKREAALMYLAFMKRERVECFNHLKSFRSNPLKQNELNSPRKQKKISHCRQCKHPGTETQHKRQGCRMCAMSTGCSTHSTVRCDCSSCSGTAKWTKYKGQIERNISTATDFPVDQITNEYLRKQMGSKIYLDRQKLMWRCPQLMPFVDFMAEVMEWERTYSVAKILPLVIVWSLRHWQRSSFLQPMRIVKERVRGGKKCLQVEWKRLSCDMVTTEPFYATVESLELVQRAFPDMVKSFLDAREAKKPKGKKITKTVLAKGLLDKPNLNASLLLFEESDDDDDEAILETVGVTKTTLAKVSLDKPNLNDSLLLFQESDDDDDVEILEMAGSPIRLPLVEYGVVGPCIDTPVSSLNGSTVSVTDDDLNAIFDQLSLNNEPQLMPTVRRTIELSNILDENYSPAPLPLLARIKARLTANEQRPIAFPKLSDVGNKC